MTLVAQVLREEQLEAPFDVEREPHYTARCLLPPVRELLERLSIPGLVEAGEGGPRVRPVGLFGLRFYPDLTVTFRGSKIVAIEVKFVGSQGRQNAIATSLGQAYLYRQAGYRHSGAFLVDQAHRITNEEIRRAEAVCRSANIDVVIRRQRRQLLAEHPR
jgi:hypothetical protein